MDLLGAAIDIVAGDPQGTPVRGGELAQALLVVVAELDLISDTFTRAIDLDEIAGGIVFKLGGASDGSKTAVRFGTVSTLGDLDGLALGVVAIRQTVFALGIDAGTDHRTGFQGSVVRIFIACNLAHCATGALLTHLLGTPLHIVSVVLGDAILGGELDQLQLRVVAVADIAPATAGAAGPLDGGDQGHAVSDLGGVGTDLALAVGDLGLAGGAEVKSDLAYLVGMGGEDRPVLLVVCPGGITDAPLIGDAGEVVAVVRVFIIIDPRRALMPGDLL
ncbi:hypothetical protein CODIS_41870 [Candidatus Thiodiazotropha endolucinida]|uniref:Uncharacterized protein n=1 Tax=Candidatus Thiodiazotropha endolucinida TaxID=1655433 RepID=A0A7Z0VHD0_9GAMM|nr:hypothetical protein CODIS_41870 [Candidatus Thiodiazotropha endolucinida]